MRRYQYRTTIQYISGNDLLNPPDYTFDWRVREIQPVVVTSTETRSGSEPYMTVTTGYTNNFYILWEAPLNDD